MPNTTIAECANTVDQDEKAHNEPSHLDLQCLPSKSWNFQYDTVCSVSNLLQVEYLFKSIIQFKQFCFLILQT